MSILGSIFSKVLGHHGEAKAAPAPATPPTSGTAASGGAPNPPIAGGGPAPSASNPAGSAPAPSGGASTAPVSPTTSSGTPGASSPSAPSQTASNVPPATSAPSAPTGGGATVDVGAMLDGLAAKNSQKLDWKHSIVDMMKLLDLDSSLSSRQELAKELNYSGDSGDSAAMNVWLHKQVMKKLAENGGKVPDDLRH